VVGVVAVVTTYPHRRHSFGRIHRLHRVNKPFFAIRGYIVEGTKRCFALFSTRTRINQLPGSVVKRSTIPVTFNEVLLNFWSNLEQSVSCVAKDRIISQDPGTLLNQIINRDGTETSQGRGRARQFGGGTFSRARFEPFV